MPLRGAARGHGDGVAAPCGDAPLPGVRRHHAACRRARSSSTADRSRRRRPRPTGRRQRRRADRRWIARWGWAATLALGRAARRRAQPDAVRVPADLGHGRVLRRHAPARERAAPCVARSLYVARHLPQLHGARRARRRSPARSSAPRCSSRRCSAASRVLMVVARRQQLRALPAPPAAGRSCSARAASARARSARSSWGSRWGSSPRPASARSSSRSCSSSASQQSAPLGFALFFALGLGLGAPYVALAAAGRAAPPPAARRCMARLGGARSSASCCSGSRCYFVDAAAVPGVDARSGRRCSWSRGIVLGFLGAVADDAVGSAGSGAPRGVALLAFALGGLTAHEPAGARSPGRRSREHALRARARPGARS